MARGARNRVTFRGSDGIDEEDWDIELLLNTFDQAFSGYLAQLKGVNQVFGARDCFFKRRVGCQAQALLERIDTAMLPFAKPAQ
jgi:hypothetical protein